jgi:hypothetical protein
MITNGETLTEGWWSLLEAFDPDTIMSFVTLSDDLLASIDRRISPYFIEQPDARGQEMPRLRHIHLRNDGLSPLSIRQNARMARLGLQDSSLVLFETHWKNTDPLIKQFTEWNFGGYITAL